jgi:hypothetical protein
MSMGRRDIMIRSWGALGMGRGDRARGRNSIYWGIWRVRYKSVWDMGWLCCMGSDTNGRQRYLGLAGFVLDGQLTDWRSV